jgi:GR25 family glycosyltransferase involved in LPS biosynthesis
MQSNLSFKDIIENLTKTSNVGFYMIHLERATDRIALIQHLEENLNTRLNITNAADGYKLVEQGHPNTCHISGPPYTRSAGEVGCTVSHVNVCKDALAKGYEYVVIFEDDCQFISNLSALNENIQDIVNISVPWDIFLLGCSPSDAFPTSSNNIIKLNRFDWTHSMIFNRNTMTKLVELYEHYYRNNTTLSVDTMYSNIIESNKLNVYTFRNHSGFFIQKQGAYSYIAEKERYNI